ncbi:MAG: aspartyl-tRNA(Asn)/glutamyl-tRNA(Gln) amidotransferase subunit C [Saprospiraceae bacterium]|jgi:aspartyl-tRNA(Asn)/glutamyl-tRNA(Gln) amidotransferase subunit C
MAVDESVISKLEKLAKINLTPEERSEMIGDLDKMLKMVDKLSEVDTRGVEPLVYMHEEKNVLRKDVISGVLDRKTGLSIAPHKEGPYFAVPKVIQK